LIRLTEAERKSIQEVYPNKQLKKSSERKQSGGKTYYVFPDDKESLVILSKLRNQSIKEIIEKG
jgi:hypothetical protein